LARRLLDAAADEACRLIRLIGRQGALPVSLLGGLAPALQARLPSAARSTLTPPKADPMDGALLRARTEAPPERYE
jgi:N-acetylglucosamine kinase-like BadF-type ATPase